MPESPAISLCGRIAAPREDLCLDFVNTRCWRGRATAAEELHGFPDLLAWLEGAGGMDDVLMGALRAWWQARSSEQTAAFAAAIRLRESIFGIFGAVGSGQAVEAADLHALNDALGTAAVRSRMTCQDGAFVWSVEGVRPSVPALLSPVLWSAADLLAGTRRDRVRQCANPECRWVFLDDSKSGNRRWCSMASCGNRAKAHRHYLKRRERAC